MLAQYLHKQSMYMNTRCHGKKKRDADHLFKSTTCTNLKEPTVHRQKNNFPVKT